MKTFYTILAFTLVLFIASCGLGSQNGDTYPFAEGSWKINSSQQADGLQGSGTIQAFAKTPTTSDADTFSVVDERNYSLEMTESTIIESRNDMITVSFVDSAGDYPRIANTDTSLATTVDGIEYFNKQTLPLLSEDREPIGGFSQDLYMVYDCTNPPVSDSLSVMNITFGNTIDTDGDSRTDSVSAEVVYSLRVNGMVETTNHILCETPDTTNN